MKIGILTASVSRSGGGIYTAAQGLARALLRQGMDCRVFGLADQFTAMDAPAWGDVAVTAAPVHGLRAFGYAPDLLPALAASNVDVLHVLSNWTYPSLAALQWRNRTGRPVVVSGNGSFDPWALANSGWKKRIVSSLYERRHLGGAACLHALCRAEAEHLRAFGLGNPICVVPNGVDLSEVNRLAGGAAPWHEHGVPRDARVLLYLGRKHPKKNITALIEAWARTSHRARGNWWLAIAGWDQLDHEAELQSLARRLDAGQLAFLGPQFGADKAACLGNASAFVLPSLSEGLPMTVLEAWSYRLPVVMTPECNIPEGRDHGAAIECAATTDGLAMGLDQLFDLDDESRRAMGEAGLALVSKRFTWDAVARDMTAVYGWVAGLNACPAFVETKSSRSDVAPTENLAASAVRAVERSHR